MKLESSVRDQLQVGLSATSADDRIPLQISWTGGHIQITCQDRNRLGCELWQLAVQSATLRVEAENRLVEIGNQLAAKIRYLLEPLAVQEIDTYRRSVQLRSSPPEREATTVRYFEILLEANSGIRFVRYEKQPAQARKPIPAIVSADTLQKICVDMIRTLDPAA